MNALLNLLFHLDKKVIYGRSIKFNDPNHVIKPLKR